VGGKNAQAKIEIKNIHFLTQVQEVKKKDRTIQRSTRCALIACAPIAIVVVFDSRNPNLSFQIKVLRSWG
jgi:hypothetical protein